MKEQISKILAEYQLTPSRFADIIGVQRSNVSHILNERNKPGYDFILGILNKFPEINAEWLITGRGEMKKNSPATPDYSKLTQKKALPLTENLFKQQETEEISKPKVSASKPEISHDTNVNHTKETNVNGIKELLILYDDGSFEVYHPKS